MKVHKHVRVQGLRRRSGTRVELARANFGSRRSHEGSQACTVRVQGLRNQALLELSGGLNLRLYSPDLVHVHPAAPRVRVALRLIHPLVVLLFLTYVHTKREI